MNERSFLADLGLNCRVYRAKKYIVCSGSFESRPISFVFYAITWKRIFNKINIIL